MINTPEDEDDSIHTGTRRLHLHVLAKLRVVGHLELTEPHAN